jgi:hypothetical protein
LGSGAFVDLVLGFDELIKKSQQKSGIRADGADLADIILPKLQNSRDGFNVNLPASYGVPDIRDLLAKVIDIETDFQLVSRLKLRLICLYLELQDLQELEGLLLDLFRGDFEQWGEMIGVGYVDVVRAVNGLRERMILASMNLAQNETWNGVEASESIHFVKWALWLLPFMVPHDYLSLEWSQQCHLWMDTVWLSYRPESLQQLFLDFIDNCGSSLAHEVQNKLDIIWSRRDILTSSTPKDIGFLASIMFAFESSFDVMFFPIHWEQEVRQLYRHWTLSLSSLSDSGLFWVCFQQLYILNSKLSGDRVSIGFPAVESFDILRSTLLDIERVSSSSFTNNWVDSLYSWNRKAWIHSCSRATNISEMFEHMSSLELNLASKSKSQEWLSFGLRKLWCHTNSYFFDSDDRSILETVKERLLEFECRLSKSCFGDFWSKRRSRERDIWHLDAILSAGTFRVGLSLIALEVQMEYICTEKAWQDLRYIWEFGIHNCNVASQLATLLVMFSTFILPDYLKAEDPSDTPWIRSLRSVAFSSSLGQFYFLKIAYWHMFLLFIPKNVEYQSVQHSDQEFMEILCENNAQILFDDLQKTIYSLHFGTVAGVKKEVASFQSFAGNLIKLFRFCIDALEVDDDEFDIQDWRLDVWTRTERFYLNGLKSISTGVDDEQSSKFNELQALLVVFQRHIHFSSIHSSRFLLDSHHWSLGLRIPSLSQSQKLFGGVLSVVNSMALKSRSKSLTFLPSTIHDHGAVAACLACLALLTDESMRSDWRKLKHFWLMTCLSFASESLVGKQLLLKFLLENDSFHDLSFSEDVNLESLPWIDAVLKSRHLNLLSSSKDLSQVRISPENSSLLVTSFSQPFLNSCLDMLKECTFILGVVVSSSPAHWMNGNFNEDFIASCEEALSKLTTISGNKCMVDSWSSHEQRWLSAVSSLRKICSPDFLCAEVIQLLLSFASFLRKDTITDWCSERWWETLQPVWKASLERVLDKLLRPLKQRVLNIYGLQQEETGSRLKGHQCITGKDLIDARQQISDLMYGEILASGLHRCLSLEHLNIWDAEVVCDLGMGSGKLLWHVFLGYPNIRKCYGVELSESRFRIASHTLTARHASSSFKVVDREIVVELQSLQDSRSLEIVHGNLFELKPVYETADIVIIQTRFRNESFSDLCHLINQFKSGCRILTYENLDLVAAAVGVEVKCSQLPINKNDFDRFATSWSPSTGHHLFLYVKE